MPRKIDSFVERHLGLIPLDLPDEDKAPESDDPLEDLAKTIEIRLKLNTKKYGPGHVEFALDSEVNKLAYVAVSPRLIHSGLKKSAIKDAARSPGIFGKCWDKPTTAGVAGCVVETIIDIWCNFK